MDYFKQPLKAWLGRARQGEAGFGEAWQGKVYFWFGFNF